MSGDVHAALGKVASIDQKHPNERKHFWDHENPNTAPAPAAAPAFLAWPRCVYKANPDDVGPDFPGCDVLHVADQAALDAALGAGWELDPIVPR